MRGVAERDATQREANDMDTETTTQITAGADAPAHEDPFLEVVKKPSPHHSFGLELDDLLELAFPMLVPVVQQSTAPPEDVTHELSCDETLGTFEIRTIK